MTHTFTEEKPVFKKARKLGLYQIEVWSNIHFMKKHSSFVSFVVKSVSKNFAFQKVGCDGTF